MIDDLRRKAAAVGRQAEQVRQQAIAAKKRSEALAFKAGPGYEGRREFRPRQVDDPMAPARGHRKEGAHPKVTAISNVRESPLLFLFSRGNIDKAQYEAGLRFRRIYEAAGSGVGAIDYSRPPVDGSPIREPLSERQFQAVKELEEVRIYLDPKGYAIIECVAGDGMTFREAASMLGYGKGRRDELYVGRRFREILDDLVGLWMLGTRC
jgi:hypothetical protein